MLVSVQKCGGGGVKNVLGEFSANLKVMALHFLNRNCQMIFILAPAG